MKKLKEAWDSLVGFFSKVRFTFMGPEDPDQVELSFTMSFPQSLYEMLHSEALKRSMTDTELVKMLFKMGMICLKISDKDNTRILIEETVDGEESVRELILFSEEEE